MARNTALPIDLLIDITSTGIKDTFTIGKLNTIIIQPYDESLPNERFSVVYNASMAAEIYGFNSSVVGFAKNYFGIVSKSATRCEQLFIYNWNKEAQPAVLKGGRTSPLSTLKSLNGAFKITIGETSKDISVDLTSATTFSNVAEKITEALQTYFAGASVTFSEQTGGFIVKGAEKGEGEKIAFLASPSPIEPTEDDTPTQPVDIHDKLGLTLAEGASVIEGVGAVDTFEKALDEIGNNNGNFYVVTPNFEFENLEQDLKTFGEWLHNSNDRFMGIYSWNNPALENILSKVTEPYEAYNGLMIDDKKQDFQNGYLAGLFSAMDLTKANGNYNIAFNDAILFQAEAITDRAKYEGLQANKANAPCKFGILGQDDTIYMDGTILGSKTSSANVYFCNSFLKFNQQIALYNMLKAQKLIGIRGEFNRAVVKSYLDEVFRNAVNANIIATGVNLTTTEKNFVIAEFMTIVPDMELVIEQLETNGYFYEISGLDITKRELYITETYVANAPVKRIVINNYILGA